MSDEGMVGPDFRDSDDDKMAMEAINPQELASDPKVLKVTEGVSDGVSIAVLLNVGISLSDVFEQLGDFKGWSEERIFEALKSAGVSRESICEIFIEWSFDPEDHDILKRVLDLKDHEFFDFFGHGSIFYLMAILVDVGWSGAKLIDALAASKYFREKTREDVVTYLRQEIEEDGFDLDCKPDEPELRAALILELRQV